MEYIEVFLESKINNVNAQGMYCEESNALIVKKGSLVSDKVTDESKFRGINAIKKRRLIYVNDNVVSEDVTFNSPSTAAAFILGRSANGPKLWKTATGKRINELKEV